MQRLLHFAAALVAILAGSAASAHTVDKGLATISLDAQSVNYHLLLAVTTVTPQGSAGVDLGKPGAPPDYSVLLKAVPEKIAITSNGKACTPATPALTPPAHEGALVTVDVRFACAEIPRTLEIRDNLFDVMGAQYHTIANVQWAGGSQQFVFMTQARELRVDVAAATAPRSAGSFFVLGIEHILTGYDHLLFLAGVLVVLRTWRDVVQTITAFTVAHSVTLALATTGLLLVPGRIVEPLIAASIVYVGLENLMRPVQGSRWKVTFGFGLVHGLGFATVLRDLGVGANGNGAVALPLASFNAGVEIGQMAVALLLVPVFWWLGTRPISRIRFAAAWSVLVIAAGSYWLVERIAGS